MLTQLNEMIIYKIQELANSTFQKLLKPDHIPLRTIIDRWTFSNFNPRRFPVSIEMNSVPKWQEWSYADSRGILNLSAGHIQAWAHTGIYSSSNIILPALATLISERHVEDYEFDISDVEGLHLSKSRLSQFRDMDHFATSDCKEEIKEISQEALQRNLSHQGIRLTKQNGVRDYLVKFGWDKRIFLSNSDGSHHFAAARYIAKQLHLKVPANLELKTFEFNKQAVEKLNSEYMIFVVRDEHSSFVHFHDHLAFRHIPYLVKKLPSPYNEYRALFFLRSDVRSKKIGQSLQRAGIFNLNSYLTQLSMHG